MSFPRQAVLATVVVAGSIAGLVLLGRSRSNQAESAPVPAPLEASTPKSLPAAPATAEVVAPSGSGGRVRNLVPPHAWLVADFKGDITGQTPFADQEGLCKSVPAPSRVALALLPPGPGQSPDVLIAAREVEDVFWGCARDRIITAGGIPLAQNDRYEVLKSPSGVVARGPAGSMVFLTSETHLEAALSVLSDLSPGSASLGPHASIYANLFQGVDLPRVSDLDLTLFLPPDWLSSVGEDKDKSPLRFIRSAFVGVAEDGSAQGGVDCEESGCAEVLAFLKRAQADVLIDLPRSMAAAIDSSLKVEHVRGAGRITINWSSSSVPVLGLLTKFFGTGSFGQSPTDLSGPTAVSPPITSPRGASSTGDSSSKAPSAVGAPP